MVSQRRVRLIAIAVAAILVMMFYYSGEASKIQNQKFYRSTLAAMRAKEEAKHTDSKGGTHLEGAQKPGAGSKVIVDDVERPAVPAAKAANSKGDEVEEISIAGRTKMTVPKAKGGQVDGGEKTKENGEEKETPEELDAKTELNDILKRAPVIIFSKSYCPHSKRAKDILLSHYDISPAPFVVELDHHPIGPALQQLLRETTGRGTVPNVMVNGKSIGGGDDMAALDQSDELASKLRQMGGKWLSSAVRKTSS
ncbi:Glutaredoxin domain-containing protein [Penicillium ucsense]|uniref:Glutaredoxin domain-containing protein n=1 Tax=Penicillium ucsense TaxID=2839758 RepID=A0A8J8W987_9EURO|nr:Glutaredoxin domain-containing protein [Penicillium ucsense]KAF7738676.1 Glutaredoxin domain-containing protein [Penicillium ucsense]